MTLIEVCLDDLEGATIADQAGADRIELCAGLHEGGTTPSIGTVRVVLGAVSRIGVQVLVRQRGGDFVYSRAEVDAMCADIEAIRALPVAGPAVVGFVIGALTPHGVVDVEATRRLVRACAGAPVTFHKAFDLVVDVEAALDTLIELGIDRVLTSGGHATAVEGVDALAGLVRRSAGRIQIMAGGGVRAHNVAELVARSGVPEVHLRAQEAVPSRGRPGDLSTLYDAGERIVTSRAVIDETLAALNPGSSR